jgi:hypothetical protein
MAAEWLNDFPAFFAHVGVRPSARHSLDRIDNDGHYAPGNVQWATIYQQTNNTRRNRRLPDGETFSQAARRLGIHVGKLRWRILRGWPLERAMDPTNRVNQFG